MASHWRQRQLRMQKELVALCLQDTTELNFNGQKIEGLGPLLHDSQRGMYLHPTTPSRPSTQRWAWLMPGC